MTIKRIIPTPKPNRLLIKTFHSLNSAPMIIIMNKTVDIFVAVDSYESVIILNLKRTTIPIPTGIAVIRNIVRPKDNKFSDLIKTIFNISDDGSYDYSCSEWYSHEIGKFITFMGSKNL